MTVHVNLARYHVCRAGCCYPQRTFCYCFKGFLTPLAELVVAFSGYKYQESLQHFSLSTTYSDEIFLSQRQPQGVKRNKKHKLIGKNFTNFSFFSFFCLLLFLLCFLYSLDFASTPRDGGGWTWEIISEKIFYHTDEGESLLLHSVARAQLKCLCNEWGKIY